MKNFLLLLLIICTSAATSAKYFYASVEGSIKTQGEIINGTVVIDNSDIIKEGTYKISFLTTDKKTLALYFVNFPKLESPDKIIAGSCVSAQTRHEINMSFTPASLNFGKLTITCSDTSLFKKFANHISAKSSPNLSKTPKDMTLAVKYNENVYFATVDEWKNICNKQDFDIIGITFCRSGENFVLFWKDQYDFDDGYMAQELAVEKYGDNLPTKAQADIISKCTELRNIARQFGSDNYGNYYWTRTRCLPPDENCAYIFCPGVPDAAYDRSPADEASNIGVVIVVSLD